MWITTQCIYLYELNPKMHIHTHAHACTHGLVHAWKHTHSCALICLDMIRLTCLKPHVIIVVQQSCPCPQIMRESKQTLNFKETWHRIFKAKLIAYIIFALYRYQSMGYIKYGSHSQLHPIKGYEQYTSQATKKDAN